MPEDEVRSHASSRRPCAVHVLDTCHHIRVDARSGDVRSRISHAEKDVLGAVDGHVYLISRKGLWNHRCISHVISVEVICITGSAVEEGLSVGKGHRTLGKRPSFGCIGRPGHVGLGIDDLADARAGPVQSVDIEVVGLVETCERRPGLDVHHIGVERDLNGVPVVQRVNIRFHILLELPASHSYRKGSHRKYECLLHYGYLSFSYQ